MTYLTSVSRRLMYEYEKHLSPKQVQHLHYVAIGWKEVVK